MPQSGLSLIEILISLLLLSLILLGFDALQLTALKETKSAYYFSVAVDQIKNMIERLRINELSKEGEQEWNRENQLVLPQGRGVIKRTLSETRVTIFWGNEKRKTCASHQIGLSGCLEVIIKR